MNIVSKLGMALVGMGVVMAGVGQPAIAATFDQREVDQSRLIAIAAPVGEISHQLLILEQIGSSRQCWEETGEVVEPLLLNFDFTGICGRSTDSNGYSLRVGGQDLGLDYSLRIQEQGDELVLVAFSNRDRTAPVLEIGRTDGAVDDFLRIELDPGWRMTKRSYQGQVLPHIYLTHDSDLNTLIASAMPTSPSESVVLIPARPSTPLPSTPTSPSTVVTSPSTPPSTSSTGLPRVTIPSTSTSPSSPSTAVAVNAVTYRVVIDATSSQLEEIRELVPDAFRTTVDGQSVVQAGIFRDRSTAEDIRELLSDRDFQARILTIPAGTLAVSRPSTTVSSRTPVVPPRSSSTSTDLPDLSNERLTVVIDPGHGGRDPGAIGINGIQEKAIVLDISEQVAEILEDQGVTVVMTRSDDREIDLAPRVAIAERVDATAFVSIHANAISMSRPEVNGVETFYDSSSSLGRQLAQSIQSNLVEETDMTDRGTKTARFYVLTQTSMPAALVEVGFVTGEDDAALLANAGFRTRIAESISRGILEYLQGQ